MASSDEVIVSLNNRVRIIKFNRPKKKNALRRPMYETLIKVLSEDAVNDEIVVTIITGTGDFYSSGNDFKDSLESTNEDPEENMKRRLQMVEDAVEAFISYPKIIIAVVNGPAIGIAATTLPLCDIVYASDKAWFETPFVKLGICAEGCSSYTFPRTLGKSKASEMILLGKRMTVQEAYNFNLISEIIPHNKIGKFIESLCDYGSLPLQSVMVSKKLMKYNVESILNSANKREVVALGERLESEDFANAIIAMMSKKSKL